MTLCARCTSRSREQSTKRRSRSESMRTVCLFYTIFLRNSRDAQRFVGFGCWLAGQANSDHVVLYWVTVEFRTLGTETLKDSLSDHTKVVIYTVFGWFSWSTFSTHSEPSWNGWKRWVLTAITIVGSYPLRNDVIWLRLPECFWLKWSLVPTIPRNTAVFSTLSTQNGWNAFYWYTSTTSTKPGSAWNGCSQ